MNADADKRIKEEIDKLNTADSLIFQTEKQLKEFGNKIPGDKKESITKSLEELKTAHKNKDLPGIDKAMANLNSMWQSASEDMYKSAQPQQPQEGPQAGPQAGPEQKQQSGNDEVTDVDFEEVKDK
jgi:molecular chaperone DnaK